MKKSLNNHPVKLLVAATTLSSGANAANLVQIDFSGNIGSSTGGNNLFADIDFNGVDDFVLSNQKFDSPFGSSHTARAYINGIRNFASTHTFSNKKKETAAGVAGETEGWISASFDATSSFGNHQGFLEVNVSDGKPSTIEITRFVYDANSTTTLLSDLDLSREETSLGTTTATSSSALAVTPVPEPSSLAILALGAAGIAMRRRRQAA